MSRGVLIVGALICVLCIKALAGWVCDGARAGGDVGELQEQVDANASAIAGLSSGKVDKDESITMPMDDAAGSNTTWSEWAVEGQVNTNGNWRMGVVSSNFVIQARQAGGWSNAVMFLKQ